jgi:hypothetical protein
MCHVDGVGPLVTFFPLPAQQCDPAIYIAVDERLCTTQSGLRESIVQNSSFPCMDLVGSGIPGVQCVNGLPPYLVRFTLPCIAAQTVDVSVCSWCIKAYSIWLVPELRTCRCKVLTEAACCVKNRILTVFLLQAEQPQVSMLLPGMPPRRE